jgi:PhnO protein
MHSKYHIRRIIKQDLDFVYNSLCDLEAEVLEPTKFSEIFIENINNPNYLYLIAEHENQKVGLITFHIQNLLHHCGLVGEIQEFYIVPRYRNKGVGKQLMEYVKTYALQNNLKSIEVTTSKRRVENVAIYENLGFGLTHNKFTIYL